MALHPLVLSMGQSLLQNGLFQRGKVSIASNMYQALLLSGDADIAFVDVNLEDGPTGPIVGRSLVDADVSVLFMTSDPGAIRGGVPGALGVIQKPILDLELVELTQYAADRRAGNTDIPLIRYPC
ncbi:response regulator [Rhizobium leguminosarum bv. viciae]|nr:response regulator [Rhizobium leguminosarum bv. viciae]